MSYPFIYGFGNVDLLIKLSVSLKSNKYKTKER